MPFLSRGSRVPPCLGGYPSVLGISCACSPTNSRFTPVGIASDPRGARLPGAVPRVLPDGFRDQAYVESERQYKWDAHLDWKEDLSRATLEGLVRRKAYGEIAERAVRIESRTNLLFSFEKMALRDALRSSAGARTFALALYAWLHGRGSEQERFVEWCDAVAALPRRQTRVLTWPVVTVFGFIARPRVHMFLKPNVTRVAAEVYDVDFLYRSTPSWPTYQSLLAFARRVRHDQADLGPRDMIDAQSFIWVQGSSEYD